MLGAILMGALAALWREWPFWASGVLTLCLYAVGWAAWRLMPAREQPPEPPEPADLRLVRLKRRD